jgi:hypothetical protein
LSSALLCSRTVILRVGRHKISGGSRHVRPLRGLREQRAIPDPSWICGCDIGIPMMWLPCSRLWQRRRANCPPGSSSIVALALSERKSLAGTRTGGRSSYLTVPVRLPLSHTPQQRQRNLMAVERPLNLLLPVDTGRPRRQTRSMSRPSPSVPRPLSGRLDERTSSCPGMSCSRSTSRTVRNGNGCQPGRLLVPLTGRLWRRARVTNCTASSAGGRTPDLGISGPHLGARIRL